MSEPAHPRCQRSPHSPQRRCPSVKGHAHATATVRRAAGRPVGATVLMITWLSALIVQQPQGLLSCSSRCHYGTRSGATWRYGNSVCIHCSTTVHTQRSTCTALREGMRAVLLAACTHEHLGSPHATHSRRVAPGKHQKHLQYSSFPRDNGTSFGGATGKLNATDTDRQTSWAGLAPHSTHTHAL